MALVVPRYGYFGAGTAGSARIHATQAQSAWREGGAFASIRASDGKLLKRLLFCSCCIFHTGVRKNVGARVKVLIVALFSCSPEARIQ